MYRIYFIFIHPIPLYTLSSNFVLYLISHSFAYISSQTLRPELKPFSFSLYFFFFPPPSSFACLLLLFRSPTPPNAHISSSPKIVFYNNIANIRRSFLFCISFNIYRKFSTSTAVNGNIIEKISLFLLYK